MHGTVKAGSSVFQILVKNTVSIIQLISKKCMDYGICFKLFQLKYMLQNINYE